MAYQSYNKETDALKMYEMMNKLRFNVVMFDQDAVLVKKPD